MSSPVPTLGGPEATLIERKRRESWGELYERRQIALIKALKLEPYQREALDYRWLMALEQIDESANRYRRRHNILRLFAIIGGVVVSGLVGLGVPTAGDRTISVASLSTGQLMATLGFVLSLMVTAAIAIDEYFRYGDRYRQQRFTAESLRIEGSRFIALAQPYDKLDHSAAFAPFMDRVEDILERNAHDWVELAAERTEKRAASFPPTGPARTDGRGSPHD